MLYLKRIHNRTIIMHPDVDDGLFISYSMLKV